MAVPESSSVISGGNDGIPGRYIVVLRESAARYGTAPSTEGPSVAQVAAELAATYSAKRGFVYEHALLGFSAEVSEENAGALARDWRVAWVEQDVRVRLTGTQNDPPWGLDRIDQRDRPISGQYVYNETAGNVHAYVIDSGIRATHVDFGGRVSGGISFVGNPSDTGDCFGHGTHVAGTIGGATYGVAKQIKLHPVRVFDCEGDSENSEIVAAVDWVTGNRVLPAVANMSLRIPASGALDTAVRNSVASGVTYAVAAGNEDEDACSVSPARVSEVLTVGSIGHVDRRSNFSNWGACLDVFAPGEVVLSAGIASDTAIAYSDGTSMAAPHVAGVAALYLGDHPNASPGSVANAVTSTATSGRLAGVGAGSPNLLVYSLLSGGGGGTVPAAPTLAAPADGAWTSLRPLLDWNPVTATPPVERYELEVRKVAGGNLVYTKLLGAGTTEQLVPSGIFADKVSYKWRVRAENAEGWSAWSAYRTLLVRLYVQVDLNPNDAEDGITRSEPGDGETVAVTIQNACHNNQNVSLRKNLGVDSTRGGVDRYFYFKVDDAFAKNGSHPAVDIRVDFWDSKPPGSGWSPELCVQYHATNNTFKQAGCVTVNNTRCLRTATFSVSDAYFGNGQNGASDFRVVAGTGDTRRFVNVVRVTKR
jgi:subtilisin family serine protease